MAEEEQLYCENCKHYYQHYIYNNLALRKIFYGHCIYKRGNCFDASICKHYKCKDKEAEEKEFEKSLQEYLALTYKKLAEIAKILIEKDR